MASRFNQWYLEYVQPVVYGYFAYDLEAARSAYQAALSSLAQVDDPDEREARRLRLETAWFMVLAELGQPNEASQTYAHLIEACHAPALGKSSTRMSRICELLARLRASNRGMEEVAAADAHALAEAVPEEMRGPHYWHELSLWAFRHGETELLEEAFAYFTMQRISSQADWLYARLQLLRRLQHGKATPDDVRQAIHRIEVQVELDDFNRVLRPHCEQQGLLTGPVQLELELKEQEVQQSGRRQPRRGS